MFGADGVALPLAPYPEDVFAVNLRTGTGGSGVNVVSNIDLARYGGAVLIKARTAAGSWSMFDTVRGTTKYVRPDANNADTTDGNTLTAFNNNGHSLGPSTVTNSNLVNYVDYTFRKAFGFFDVVTYTGNGSTQKIPHNLGTNPTMMWVKRLDSAQSWAAYLMSWGGGYYSTLDVAAAPTSSATVWNNTDPTYREFSVGNNAATNANGATYVAYLWSGYGTLDPDGDSAQAATLSSAASDPSGNLPLTMPWEPQFTILKDDSTGAWLVFDTWRGMDITGLDASLSLDSNAGEVGSSDRGRFDQWGATFIGLNASVNYNVFAIRRPRRKPALGTEVFCPVAFSGTGGAVSITTPGFDVDTIIQKSRSGSTGTFIIDRTRNKMLQLDANSTESTSADTFLVKGGYGFSGASTSGNTSGQTHIHWVFARRKLFFEMSLAQGTGSAWGDLHNLVVVPEFMIRRCRTGALTSAIVYHKDLGYTKYLLMGSNAGPVTDSTYWYAAPTDTSYSVGTASNINNASYDYVTWLFATLAGVSKVGSYTGNGTNQVINCGFVTAARGVLIKRTDAAGDWFFWDSARGIVAGNDPHSGINLVAAEVTTDDSIDPDNSGFVVNQVAATNVNVNTATYIFIAFA